MKKIMLLLFLISIISCSEKQPQRIVYPENNNENSTEKPIIDTDIKDKLIVDLPQKLDSSNYILFPLKRIPISNSKTRISKTSYSWNRYSIPLENLIFENINTGKTHFITNDTVKIVSFIQLYNAKNTPEKIVVYEVIHKDSNQDGYLDNDDIKSLFISNSNGRKFTQLSPSSQQLLTWNYISESKTIYFKTTTDTNKDGDFDNKG